MWCVVLIGKKSGGKIIRSADPRHEADKGPLLNNTEPKTVIQAQKVPDQAEGMIRKIESTS
jgi:hypothetical protein